MPKEAEMVIDEIQHRLFEICGLSSSSTAKNGIIYFTIQQKIQLGFVEDKFVRMPIEMAYRVVLETLSKIWLGQTPQLLVASEKFHNIGGFANMEEFEKFLQTLSDEEVIALNKTRSRIEGEYTTNRILRELGARLDSKDNKERIAFLQKFGTGGVV